MLQELFILKRRKRRAPVQGFNARMVRGNLTLSGELFGECGGPAGFLRLGKCGSSAFSFLPTHA
jgi:hypothetical protein